MNFPVKCVGMKGLCYILAAKKENFENFNYFVNFRHLN